MAISYKGAASVNAYSGNSSSTVTIPADSTLAVILSSYWDSGTGGVNGMTSVTLDGQTATEFADVADMVDRNGLYGSIVTGFTTGASKTLAWTWDSNEAISENGKIYVLFFSGASSTPVASDTDAAGGSGAPSISLNNTATTQYGVVLAGEYNNPPNLTQPSGSTRNYVYNNDVANANQVDVCYYTYSSTGAKTYDADTTYSAIVGVILEEDSGGGAFPYHSIKRQRNNIKTLLTM